MQTNDQATVREGGCSCGALRYRVLGEPLSLTACHCHDCQRSTGAAFGMSMLFLKDALRLVTGAPRTYTKIFPDDGREKYAKFCGDCGARLWTEFSKFPQILNLKPGTLDDCSRLDPVAHIWLRSAQPWVPIPEGALRFDEQPTDFGVILKAWSSRRQA